MFTTQILPIDIFAFECEVIDEIIEAVKDEPFKDHDKTSLVLTDLVLQTKSTFIHANHPVLDEYIQRCNDEMWQHVKQPEDTETRLVTTQCWMNESKKGQRHRHHTHPNSVVSGILYLCTSDTPTMFTHPNLYKNGFIQVYPADQHHDTFSSEAVKGFTVLFPSSLSHVVPYHNEDEIRRTISWNTFLEGSIKVGIGTLKVGVVK